LLADLRSHGGCLDNHNTKAPRYALDDAQKAAISAALNSVKAGGVMPSYAQSVQRTLIRHNCIACHERDGLGGVEAARDAFFHSDMPEMGDEGRLPPSLTGIGGKLTTDWLQALFENGAHDRPYMLTRMPKFGLANLGNLVHDLKQADNLLIIRPAPHLTITEDVRRAKAAGRRLVGSQGFSCIKCHTFAGQRSSGIQAISLTTMTRRLRPEWFYHYLQNPLEYRPGTRMPTPFPDGQTTLPMVHDGTVAGQTAAIWTYLADGDNALWPVGLVTGKIELMAFDEPVIYRNFIEGAGTRAIGVGYPEKLNLAFDAENMRLALLWHGGFIDAARHWTARGAGFEKPLGDNVLKLPEGPALAVLEDDQAAWPDKTTPQSNLQFRGYRLNTQARSASEENARNTQTRSASEGKAPESKVQFLGEKQRPTFIYSFHKLSIEDYPRPIGDQDVFVIQRTLRITGQADVPHAYLRLARGESIQKSSENAYRIDNRWTLHVTATANSIIRRSQDEFELLVPIKLQRHIATIDLTYDW
jgi:mono/diheme cytochrome c family protein